MSDAYALVPPETDMKQKRSKSQLNDNESKLQNPASTINGGNLDRTNQGNVKESNCASGVCSVIWKPDSMKR